jgi:isopenicillin-N epimerase
MTAVPIRPGECERLQQALWEEHQIEVPIIDWQGQRLVRVSCHAYTVPEHLDRLLAGLAALLGRG